MLSISNAKRLAAFESDNNCKRKRKSPPDHHVFWKLWLLRNYELVLESCTTVQSIITHAACTDQKENLPEKMLSPEILGKLVRKIWKGQVKNVRRGSRDNRIYQFLNLSKKQHNPIIPMHPSQSETRDVQVPRLPPNWQAICVNDKKLNFIRLQSWQANNRCATTEVSMEFQDEGIIGQIVLRANGSKVDLNDVNITNSLMPKGLNSTEQIEHILDFIDKSALCKGYHLESGENVIAMLPHHLERVTSTEDASLIETVAFSDECFIISPSNKATRCSSCANLVSTDRRRKKRQQSKDSVHPKCNRRYLERIDIEKQLNDTRKEKANCMKREKYWRGKFNTDAIEIQSEDHDDLSTILNSVDESRIPDDMKILWQQQQKIVNTPSPHGYRWHPKVMKLCLDLYCKNPHVLDPLRNFIKLPSNRTIRMYKNKVEQTSGWNDNILRWCLNEAKKQGLKEQDYWGGFVIDEMKIQENLEMVIKNGKHKLSGFVNLGSSHDVMSQLTGNTEPELATQVLQILFLSDCGFRFPIAQFPSGSCTPSDLYYLFWEGVIKMLEEGFTIYWCILDGADTNRQFVKIHFIDCNPSENYFMTQNIYTNHPMIFIMDPKHNVKKIRNNITKSNHSGKPRCLEVKGNQITWEQFKKAYNWDQSNCSLPVHERLTEMHFDLDSASKMRNHLAEDVLDRKMLFLMEKYQQAQASNDAQLGTSLDATVALLRHTSCIVQMFNDKLPISSLADYRLKQLGMFYNFMLQWREESKENNSHFISTKLCFDIQSMCIGFVSLVSVKLKNFPESVIKPAIVNQDCVENHFCQVRACNGQNNNPTFRQQESTQNSIRFGQSTIGRKSSAGKSINAEQLTTCNLPEKQ